jgi:gamma-glutamyltranspeptidase/glutathione hydrolase
MAAVRILEMGGNAIDAGVAAGMCINVLQPDMTNIGGVAPIVLYDATEGAAHTISGLGTYPAAISREFYISKCNGDIPPGVLRSVMPSAIDAWMTALRLYGTMTFAEVAAPAIALAEDGFSAYYFFCENTEDDAEILTQWPTTAEIYLPGGRAPRVGERFVQRDLGTMLRMLIEAEQGAAHRGREAAIQAARDRFYKGDIAERIADFFAEQGGLLTLDDLKAFSVEVEDPVTIDYRGYTINACGPWCQGPVVPEALKILEGYDLASLGQNSADSVHLIAQALNAAFADRHHYIGDPRFVDVPIQGLTHPDYAAEWRDRISREKAFPGMPEPGNAWKYQPNGGASRARAYTAPSPLSARTEPDTSYLCIVDEAGNAFSATPSDGVSGSPVIPGLGFIVSGRGNQAWLDADHPAAIEPGKRPRLTPNPGLILKDGKVYAPYGTPGGDVQPQAMTQLVVNLIDYGMDPQAAVEAPRVASYNYPATDHPHAYTPAILRAEARYPKDVLAELSRRGHNVELWPDLTPKAGSLCTVVVDRERGFMTGGADLRRISYAIGW